MKIKDQVELMNKVCLKTEKKVKYLGNNMINMNCRYIFFKTTTF